jgi:hypothetical protein
MTVKLVCFEIVIVSVATRAMLALMGRPPLIPDLVWGCVALVAALTGMIILISDVLVATRAKVVYPPRIPLERIGPYRRDEAAAPGGDRRHDVSLN